MVVVGMAEVQKVAVMEKWRRKRRWRGWVAAEKGAATGAAVMGVEGMVVEGMRSEVQKVR